MNTNINYEYVYMSHEYLPYVIDPQTLFDLGLNLLVFILPSILYSNAGAPVAQLEHRIRIQMTQVQILAVSR